jgi:hypothetical protein
MRMRKLTGPVVMALSAMAVSPALAQQTPANAPDTILQGMPLPQYQTPAAPASDQDVAVLARPRPEYEAAGIPLGGFIAYPTIGLGAAQEHNVFYLASAQSDTFFTETPSLRVQSDWGRHYLDAYMGADNFDYITHTQLDLTDWKGGADGRLDISRAFTINAQGFYGLFHESLSSPNTVGFQASPNRYNQGHVDLDGKYQLNRFTFDLEGTFDRFDYSDTPLVGGGSLFNGDRNESTFVGSAKATYDFSPGYSGFVRVLYDGRDFDNFLDRSGDHRSSTGYHYDGGLDLQITHLVQGSIFVGYFDQFHSQQVATPLPDFSAVDYGATLNWFVTPLLTAHVTASHYIQDTTLSGVAGTNEQVVQLAAEYELERNIILKPSFFYDNSNFIGVRRVDNTYTATMGVHYLINHNMSADLGYSWAQRSSSITGQGYMDNVVNLGLNLQL